MKKLLLLCVLFLFYISSVDASVNSARSYTLMDMNTGRVLESKDKDNPMLIASITKIMTCVLAIESNRLDEIVVVDDSILKAYGSGIYIQIGEEITLRDLLYGLMLRSGNDASVMVASYISGSEEEFVKRMNNKAKEIGMKNTIFLNSSGLDNSDNGNYSTTYDMALLTRYAMGYDEYRNIVGTKKYKVKTNYKTYIWHNKNKLLEEDYITGGKTGFTKKAGRTLVSSAKYNNKEFIVVTIKDGDDWNTHKDLYKKANDKYINYLVLDKDKFKVSNDTYYKNNLYIEKDLIIPLTNDESKNITTKIELEKKDTYNNHDKVGKVNVYLKEELITSVDIYVLNKDIINVKRGFLSKIWELVKFW